MLNTELFEYAEIHCASKERYIMAAESRSCEATTEYINTNNLRIESLVFNPRTNQIRFMLLPCKANKKTTEVFNTTPTLQFLRLLWDLDVDDMRPALTQYMVQSDLRHEYEALSEVEKTWLSSVILGAKED